MQRAAEIRTHLGRIRASRTFARAETLTRLLTFLVEGVLAGRAPELREYVLAEEVLGRTNFDPQTDTIVRVQANRLRARLKEYYETEGARETERIRLRKGSYVPAFEAVAAEPQRPLSLAVLPLQNFTGDARFDCVSDGLTEEIINVFARVDGLRVVARTSVFAFKDQQMDAREIARRLDVTHLIEGSVRRDADTLRVTAQLIDAENGYHLYSGNYERRAGSVFELQDAVARHILKELSGRFPGRLELPDLVRRPPNPDAYGLYLKAMHQFRRLTPAATERAIELLHEALAIDPDYADAAALLAANVMLLGWIGVAPPRHTFEVARQYAERALSVEADHPLATSTMSFVKAYEWHVAGALDLAELACELAPGDFGTQIARAYWLLAAGRADAAVAAARQAAASDPLNLLALYNVGFVLWMAGRSRDAVRAWDAVFDLDPNYAEALCNKSAVCAEIGEFEEAIACAKRGQELHGGVYLLEALAYCYGKSGRQADARACIERLEAARSQTYVAPLRVAIAWTGLGDEDQVFAWLERAFDDHDPRLVWLFVWPVFRPFHSHPRFIDLAARIGLTAVTA